MSRYTEFIIDRLNEDTNPPSSEERPAHHCRQPQRVPALPRVRQRPVPVRRWRRTLVGVRGRARVDGRHHRGAHLCRCLQPDPRAIAVVGSRKALPQGLRMAYNIASRLTGMDVTVVSGLAEGVDSAAHRAALEGGGRTVAVIGTGIDRYYPPKNRDLQEEIATRGMLLSQFLPGSPPTRASFPMRNAVMSGYAAATIVVEAGEHSGARIQVRYALQYGRPLIFPRELLVNQRAQKFAERSGVYVVDNME